MLRRKKKVLFVNVHPCEFDAHGNVIPSSVKFTHREVDIESLSPEEREMLARVDAERKRRAWNVVQHVRDFIQFCRYAARKER